MLLSVAGVQGVVVITYRRIIAKVRHGAAETQLVHGFTVYIHGNGRQFLSKWCGPEVFNYSEDEVSPSQPQLTCVACIAYEIEHAP